jgi:hypothetical protein
MKSILLIVLFQERHWLKKPEITLSVAISSVKDAGVMLLISVIEYPTIY